MKAKAVSALRSKRGLRSEVTRAAEPQVVELAPQTTMNERRADTMKTIYSVPQSCRTAKISGLHPRALEDHQAAGDCKLILPVSAKPAAHPRLQRVAFAVRCSTVGRASARAVSLPMNLGVAASRQSAANTAVLEWRRSPETPLRFGGSSANTARTMARTEQTAMAARVKNLEQ